MKRINSDLVLFISLLIVGSIFSILYEAFGLPSLIQNINNEVAYYLASALFTIAGIGLPMGIIYKIVRSSKKLHPLTKKERKRFTNGLFIFALLIGAVNYLSNILSLLPDGGLPRLLTMILVIILIIWYNQKCIDIEKVK